MGGHLAGEVAAAVALEAAVRTIRHRPWVTRGASPSPTALTRLLERAVATANFDVFSLAQEHGAYSGMGCTLTLLLAAGSTFVLSSVGDSRFYRLRAGTCEQLTIDHTVGEEMVRAGALTREQVAGMRYARLLSQAVGIKETVRADIFTVDFQAGDRFVACTDGLSVYVVDEQALVVQAARGSVEEAAERLVAFANEAGGRDNITAVVGDVV